MERRGGAVAMPDEFSLIEHLFAPLSGPQGLGLKDDAALLTPRAGYDLVLTKDALAEGRHYLPDDPPQTVAKKLLRVNLSDLAAKGAEPRGYLLSCGWSDSTSFEWMQAFAEGLGEDQSKFGIQLWGGDTIKLAGPSVFSLTAIGEAPSGQMVTRSGAAPGDDLWITGTIGDAALGLLVAQGRLDVPQAIDREFLIERYRVPEPPVAFGRELRGVASAALDVSDGLVADIEHLCAASNIGVEISRDAIPLSDAARACVARDGNAWLSVLSGGDDYQILFSAHPNQHEQVITLARGAGIGAAKIGQVTQDTEIKVVDWAGKPIEIPSTGFTHF